MCFFQTVTNNINTNTNTFPYTIRGTDMYDDGIDTKWKEERRNKAYERYKRRMIVKTSPIRIKHRYKADTLPKSIQEHYSTQQRYGYVYVSYGFRTIPLLRDIEEHHRRGYLNVKQQIDPQFLSHFVPPFLPIFVSRFVPDYNSSVKQSKSAQQSSSVKQTNSKPNAQIKCQNLIIVFSNSYLFKNFIEYIELINLCNTCKKILESKKYVNYKLNKYYSLMYYKDEKFRTTILKKIFNPRKQLYVNLSMCDDVVDVSVLGNVHYLDLSDCKNISDDISALGNVNYLNLRYCNNIKDVSPLENVYNLNLNFCINIMNINKLANVHTLDFSNCTHLTNEDIKIFGNVYSLNLSFCTQITEVISLEKVHTLTLRGCYNIIDVSSLGKVHTLNLQDCYNIIDVRSLGGCHTLDLTNCYSITNVESLGKVTNLILINCIKVKNLDAVKNVPNLKLFYISDDSLVYNEETEEFSRLE